MKDRKPILDVACGGKMKAYIVSDKDGFAEYTTVVFAESIGKAKALALSTDAFEDFEFKDIRVKRCPALDKSYRGVWEMDWENQDDRVAMVRYAGYHCVDDYFDPEDCRNCNARLWCEKYAEYLSDISEKEREGHDILLQLIERAEGKKNEQMDKC